MKEVEKNEIKRLSDRLDLIRHQMAGLSLVDSAEKYAELEKELEKIGIINLYASIASPIEEDEYLTNNIEQFHAHLGFEKVGEFHKCGYKFGRFDNMIFMEKLLK